MLHSFTKLKKGKRTSIQNDYKHAANDILEKRLKAPDYSNWDEVAKIFGK